ncbi:MAG TPA: helix-turn-helix domain-containing protein [Longimicrobium sp.]|nr:helix-turn-helix domain-containing protein [Longimicrobium sp.]
MTTDPETEDRILDAAHAVFLRRGTAGARMQEIADEAGVNKALLHYYFRSKDKLAEAVFQRAARELFPVILRTIMSDAPIEEKVERVVQHELEILSRNPQLPGYLLSEMHHHPERIEQLVGSIIGAAPSQVAPPMLARLGAQIQERVAAGTMRPIAPEQFLVNLVSLCIFPFAARPLLTVVLGTGPEGFDQLIEQRKQELAGFFLNALRP